MLCLGYRGNLIKEYFLNYEAMNSDFTICLGSKSQIAYHGDHGERGIAVTLAETGGESMTGGRSRRVAKYLENQESFMVTYGDGLGDVDLQRLAEFHASHGKSATVTAFPPASRFGILNIDDSRRVTGFNEKPRSDAWASAGFFVF